MFFSKFVALATLPLLAMAGGEPTKTVTVTSTATSTPASSCSTGDLQCCDSTALADSTAGLAALALIEVAVSDVDALIGIECSGISLVDLVGGACDANAVCCQDNSEGNLISIGCVPVTL